MMYDAFLYLNMFERMLSVHMCRRSWTYRQERPNSQRHGAKSVFCVRFLSGVVYTLYIRYTELAEPVGDHSPAGVTSPCMLKHRIYYCIELNLQRTLNSMCNICSLLKDPGVATGCDVDRSL